MHFSDLKRPVKWHGRHMAHVAQKKRAEMDCNHQIELIDAFHMNSRVEKLMIFLFQRFQVCSDWNC
jgi:hypothetical protein